jgi:hypothetical protein
MRRWETNQIVTGSMEIALLRLAYRSADRWMCMLTVSSNTDDQVSPPVYQKSHILRPLTLELANVETKRGRKIPSSDSGDIAEISITFQPDKGDLIEACHVVTVQRGVESGLPLQKPMIRMRPRPP